MSRSDRSDLTSAYHEACHAVISLAMGLPVAGALILPRATKLNVRARGYVQTLMSKGGDLSNAGGMTLVGCARDIEDSESRIAAEDEPIPEEHHEMIPPMLIQTTAPAVWEMQTDFVDKMLIQTDTKGDALAVRKDWATLPQELYDKCMTGVVRDGDVIKPKPCESAVGLPELDGNIQEPFPLWYSFLFLRLPAVQKAIAAVGDYLFEYHWATGDIIQDLTLQVFEEEIRRYQQPVDDFKHEFEGCSPLFAEVLRIDRLHTYDDIRRNIRRVKAIWLLSRRENKRRKKA